MQQVPKLLVVDDNQNFAETIKLILSGEYEIDVAYRGLEAIEKAKSDMKDLILLDLRLPGMGGLETLRRLNSVSPGSQVIIVTAYGDVQSIRSAIELGAVGYVEKGNNMLVDISNALKRALAKRQEHVERSDRLNQLRKENDELLKNLLNIEMQIKNQRELRYDSVLSAISTALGIRQDAAMFHARSIEEYVPPIATKLGLNREEEKELRVAAALHDVGMLSVSETILTKPDPLTRDEWQRIMEHPRVGARMIRSFGKWTSAIQPILCHHERMDGSGYPMNLKGDQIPFSARVISVIDAYDAMTSPRAYRSALTREQALDELMKEESKFDMEIVKAFSESL